MVQCRELLLLNKIFIALEMVLGVTIFQGDEPETASIVPIAFPIIAGAGILGIRDIQSNEIFSADIIITALLSSFFIGIVALKILIKLLELGKFYIFGIYCICLGLGSIFI